jgi:chromosomal replication initiator protein
MIHVDPEEVMALLKSDELNNMIRDLSAASGFTFDELIGPGRAYALSRVRQYGMLLAYRAGYSTPQIGAAFKRDHTTVLHGLKAAKRRMQDATPNAKRQRVREVKK